MKFDEKKEKKLFEEYETYLNIESLVVDNKYLDELTKLISSDKWIIDRLNNFVDTAKFIDIYTGISPTTHTNNQTMIDVWDYRSVKYHIEFAKLRKDILEYIGVILETIVLKHQIMEERQN